MARVDTDDINAATAFNNLAILADTANTRSDFHGNNLNLLKLDGLHTGNGTSPEKNAAFQITTKLNEHDILRSANLFAKETHPGCLVFHKKTTKPPEKHNLLPGRASGPNKIRDQERR